MFRARRQLLWHRHWTALLRGGDWLVAQGAATLWTGPSHSNLVEEWYAIDRLAGLDLMAKLRRALGGPFAGGARRRAWLVLGLLIGFGGPARAMDLSELAGYIRKNFTVEDGLLSNNVNAVLQTRDGFLWIGTQDGLLRFDGRHFTPIEFLPQASPILVSALAEAPDGALWVGTRGGLARIPSGGSSELGHTVSSLYHPGSGDGDSVQCLHFSRNGDLWVGTHTGLYRFEHGRF